MKKICFFLSILLLSAVVAMAQDNASPTGPTQAVTVNVFGMLVNYYGGAYEHAVGDHFSIRGEVGVSPNLIWATGLGLFTSKAEVRYYFGHAINGFYLGVGGVYDAVWGSITTTGTTTTFTGSMPGVGAYLGGKWIMGQDGGFFLEPYVGYESYFSSLSVTAKDSSGNSASASAAPSIGGFVYGMGLGWAF